MAEAVKKKIDNRKVAAIAAKEAFEAKFEDHTFTGDEDDKLQNVSVDDVPYVRDEIEDHIIKSRHYLKDHMFVKDGANYELRMWEEKYSADPAIGPVKKLTAVPQIQGVKALFMNKKVWWPTAVRKGDGYVKWDLKNPVDIWLSSAKRPTYERVIFAPYKWGGNADHLPAGTLNLFQGWNIEPDFDNISEKCQKIRNHLLHVICGSDHNFYEWFMSWLAFKVQNPHRKIGTAISLQSGQGVGKGTLIKNVMGKILGNTFRHINNIGMVTNRFNANFEDACLLFLDEAFFTRDKEAAARLKTLITEEEIVQEAKYKNPESKLAMFDIIIATNYEQAAPIERDDRRYTVAQISAAPQSDEYFQELHAEIENGGAEAFFGVLLNWDLDNKHINVHKPYDTLGRVQQKLLNLDTVDAWWFQCLKDGSVYYRDSFEPMVFEDYQNQAIPAKFLSDALSYYEKSHKLKNATRSASLTASFRKIAPSLKHDSKTKRFNDGIFMGYRGSTVTLPTLQNLREDFQKYIGSNSAIWEDFEEVETQEVEYLAFESAPTQPAKRLGADDSEAPF